MKAALVLSSTTSRQASDSRSTRPGPLSCAVAVAVAAFEWRRYAVRAADVTPDAVRGPLYGSTNDEVMKSVVGATDTE